VRTDERRYVADTSSRTAASKFEESGNPRQQAHYGCVHTGSEASGERRMAQATRLQVSSLSAPVRSGPRSLDLTRARLSVQTWVLRTVQR
jgi:hypothetical protein